MYESPTTTVYPYFLGPSDHCLAAHYRRLNRMGLILILFIFVLNEFFIRPHLSNYKKTPDELWSIIALTLNSDIPAGYVMAVIAAFGLYGLCMRINFYFLPQWGPRPIKVGMKSGLPTSDEYKTAYFNISSRVKKIAFSLWHSIAVPISFFWVSGLICMFFNLLRSL